MIAPPPHHRARRTLLRVTPLVMCALVLGLSSWATAGTTTVSGCMDEFTLAMEVLETPIIGMSVSNDEPSAVREEFVDDGMGFDYGMSCDGPLSCSPQLVYALEQLERRRHTGQQGPMCIPGDPDCNVSPGIPRHQPNIELGHTIVPFVSEPACCASARHPEEATSRPYGTQNVISHDLVRRLDRPPCLR